MIANFKTFLAAAVLLLSAAASAQDTINVINNKLDVTAGANSNTNALSHLRGRASGSCPAVPCTTGYICASLSGGAPNCYNPNVCKYSYTSGNVIHQVSTYCAYGTQCTSNGCLAPSPTPTPTPTPTPSPSAAPAGSTCTSDSQCTLPGYKCFSLVWKGPQHCYNFADPCYYGFTLLEDGSEYFDLSYCLANQKCTSNNGCVPV